MKNNNWLRPLTYALVIFIGPLLGYYLFYVDAREEALLDRTYSHLTNITARTEARFNSVYTVVKNACSSPYKFKDVLDKNELGLSLIQSSWDPWDACLKVKNNSSRENQNIQPLGRERLQITFGDIVVSADTSLLVGSVDLSQRFHDIFIFDGNRKIVYQKYSENGRVDHFDELKVDAEDDDKVLISDPLNSLRINYRGRWYLMPSQPLQVDFVDQTDKKDSWLMVGLIEESQFNAEKLRFQPDTVALVVLFVAITMLIGPFLKIWYLGRFESLKKMDLVFLIGAGFTLCALLTLVVIHIDVRASLSKFMNEQLQANAKQMVNDVQVEIKENLRELTRAESAMRSVYNDLSDAQYQRFDGCSFEAAKENRDCNFKTWTGDLLTGNNLAYKPERYPFYNMAYLMDRKGCQIVKWSTQPQPTNVGCFGDRSYFLRPLVNTKLPLNLFSIDISQSTATEDAAQVQHFFIEFITSRTTGEKSIAISIPITDAAAQQDCLQINPSRPKPCVAVLTSSSLRALQPVLSYGFGFGLVDKDGALLAHHEGNANTEQNLIDELSEGSLLRAALYSNSEAEFDSDYRSRRHHFLVKPLNIQGGRFSLVMFYAQDTMLMPLLESTGTALMAWLIWFTLLFCLALTTWQLNKFLEGRLFVWINRLLQRFDLILLFSTAAIMVASLFWPILSVFAPLYVVPVLMIWLFKVSNNFRSRPLTVVSISWVLMLSATSLPIMGLFRMINAETFAGFFQLHVLDYQQSINEQRTIIRQWLNDREIDLADDRYKPFQTGDYSPSNYFASFWKQYPLFSPIHIAAADCISNVNLHNYLTFTTEPHESKNPWHLMLGELPDYSDNTVQLHAMYRNSKQLQANGNKCWAGELSNTLRAQQFRGSNHGIAYALGAVFLIILGVALWYVLVRTLGLRTENYLRLHDFAIPKKDSGVRQLIYGLGEVTKLNYFLDADPKRLTILDMRLLSHDEVLAQVNPLLDAPIANTSIANKPANTESQRPDILVLDHFDDCLIDREVVLERIRLLERLSKHPTLSVVILLTIDPLSFITATFDTEADAPLISRLASVLARYNVSHYQESVPELLGTSKEDFILREECYHPNLHSIYHSIHDQSSQKQLDSNEIIQLVKSRANAIYQQMWNLCTRAEKIMLVELAHENLVNPNNWDIARRLKQRGYLRRDPFHRIFNESFKQFILRMERVENIESWRKEGTSTWHNIRAPLFVVVIGAIIFLAITQPSFFNSVFAFAAAGTASLPFIVNLIMAKLKSGIEK